MPVPFAASPSGPVTADFLASCATGEKPFSGGFAAQNQVVLTASHPTADGRQWRFRFQPTGTAPSAQAFLVCAPAGSSGGTTPVPSPG